MKKHRITYIEQYQPPYLRIFYPVENHHGGRWRSLARTWRKMCWQTYKKCCFVDAFMDDIKNM